VSPVRDLDLVRGDLDRERVKNINTNRRVKRNIAGAGNQTISAGPNNTKGNATIGTAGIEGIEIAENRIPYLPNPVFQRIRNWALTKSRCPFRLRWPCLPFPERGGRDSDLALPWATTDVIRIIMTGNSGTPSLGSPG
jgi:hypothetical protein